MFEVGGGQVGSNSSSATGTWSSLVNGTSYNACFSLTGDHESDYEVVMFTYEVINSYTLTITGTGVSNTTIAIDSQAWSTTSSGNETGTVWQIGLLYANRTQAVANSSSASGSWTSLVNGTSYIACFSITGDHSVSDYAEIMFTYEIIYVLSITATGVSNTTITVSHQVWSATYSGNDTSPSWQIQLLFANRTEAVANSSLAIGQWLGLSNATSYIGCFSIAGDYESDYEEVMFTVNLEESIPLPEPIPTWILGGDINLLSAYLIAGDYIGFIIACYSSMVGQLAYVVIILLFSLPLALRTQSITYVAIVWIILGVLFQTAVPLIGPATVILEILGIGALIFKLFTRE